MRRPIELTAPHAPVLRPLALVLLLVALDHAPIRADQVVAISRSATSPPGTADGASASPTWSRDGRFATFTSRAGDLAPGLGDPAGKQHLFLFDRAVGSVRLVDHAAGSPTTFADGSTFNHAISADGGWVAFESEASDLVPGQVDGVRTTDVFLWNRATDTTILVSRAEGTVAQTANLRSFLPAISDDGRHVAFTSGASDLAGLASGPFATDDVFLYDRDLDATRLVSHSFAPGGTDGANDHSSQPSISGDGRFVTFASDATNLLGGITDDNGQRDVYLWDRDADPAASLTLLSRQAGDPGVTGDGDSTSPAISADGTAVVFVSGSTDLEGVVTDTNVGDDVFHYDRETDVLRLVSRHRFFPGTTGDAGVFADRISLSGDGEVVAFAGFATDHVLGVDDANGEADVFVWTGGPLRLVSHAAGSPTTVASSSSSGPMVSLDGRHVAFESFATDLVAGQGGTAGATNVFLWERETDVMTLVSHRTDSELAGGNGDSRFASLAADATLVAFGSRASDLVPDDGNGTSDVLLHGGSLLFADGFESGDTSAWSATSP